ncbi:hypothetical protein ABBQ38_014971 [Trebouxia sp. C0009 RCD-2024]
MRHDPSAHVMVGAAGVPGWREPQVCEGLGIGPQAVPQPVGLSHGWVWPSGVSTQTGLGGNPSAGVQLPMGWRLTAMGWAGCGASALEGVVRSGASVKGKGNGADWVGVEADTISRHYNGPCSRLEDLQSLMMMLIDTDGFCA